MTHRLSINTLTSAQLDQLQVERLFLAGALADVLSVPTGKVLAEARQAAKEWLPPVKGTAADPEPGDEDDNTPHCERPHATPRELELRQRRAWSAAGSCPMCGFGNSNGRLCPACVADVRRLNHFDRRQWDRYQPINPNPPLQGTGYTPAGLLGMTTEA